MEEPEKKVLREMRQTFAVSSATAPDRLVPGQGKTHRVKVFKSGNSLALRLPKALGLAAGMEMELEAAPDGGYALKPVGMPKRKFDIDKVWGSATSLKPIDEDDRWFEERTLDWGNAGGDAAA
jgi:antitoxin VapB